ncbi:zona pellucida sperm-binding protein 4-like [Clarias gariepinus]|uniref:zona pellucida sperm-binding protein 4-like n=1 Tax=Clarias gariepinus TaxID=13013 RepID=UPI00234C6CC3|nr:zona pellucida sperm-binding protein 4-like [Clarias gariepinus]
MVISGVRLVLVGVFLALNYVCSVPASVQDVKMAFQDSKFPVKLNVQPSAQFNVCQVQGFERVPCGLPGIQAAQCTAINCCFDGSQCYYGRKVTVQCTLDGQFILVVARDTTLPRISLNSINLLGGNAAPCGPVDSNVAFAIYQFPVTACGTTMRVQGGYVVYENKMISGYEVGVGPRGAITRDTHFELYFQCRYSGVNFAAVSFEPSAAANPMPFVASGPLQVAIRLGNGRCATKGCNEEKVAYNSYYMANDYPVTKILREPVFVEVYIVGRNDPNIVLVLGDCWATASPNPYSGPQWDLLLNGCPYTDDHYLTKLIPVNGTSGLAYPTHYRRFVLKMFAFVNPDMTPVQETVFIHCSTSVCLPSAQDSCQPVCARRRRDVSAEERANKSAVVSSGEVIYTQRSTPSSD